jgi:hypothetical protein
MSSCARRRARRERIAPIIVRRTIATLAASVVLATASIPPIHAADLVAPGPVGIRAEDLTGVVDRDHTFTLPIRASHVALHWPGRPHAVVEVAFSHDGVRFGRPVRVQPDELEGHGADDAAHGPADDDPAAHEETETYSSVMVAGGARQVRVTSDRLLGRVSLVAIDSRDRRAAGRRPAVAAAPAGPSATPAGVDPPPVVSRAAWGADESLRFDGYGKEIDSIAFHPVQKLIVHHTAGSTGDPDPPATVRAIYYFHTIVRGWGDIGYHFLIDEAGTVYEGRYSRPFAPGEPPTGEDHKGNVVQGTHAADHNLGTIGISLLGTLTRRDATPAARASLERLLAAKADRHDVDPLGADVYVNRLLGTYETFPNIAGHRDVNATSCPGGFFYGTLPTLRETVSSLIGSTFWQSVTPHEAVFPVAGGTASFTISLRRVDGFADPVDLDVLGLPSGWVTRFDEDPADGTTATLTVEVPASAGDGTYPFRVRGTTGSTVRTTRLALVKGAPSDAVAPVAKAPRVSVQLGSLLGTDDAWVVLRWSATDDQSRISDSTLQGSTDGGPWTTLGTGPSVSTYTVEPVERGHAYRFRVNATDASDNTSDWATTPSFSVRRVQETSASVRYNGAWTPQTDTSASGGSLRYATTTGSTARLTFTGRGVAWVSPKGTTKGRARISIDGSYVTTIDLSVGPAGPRRVAFTRSWLGSDSHSMTIRQAAGRIDIDAFVVLE